MQSSAAVGYSPYAYLVNSHQPLGYWRLGEASGIAAVDERASHPGTYQNGVVLGATGALYNETNTSASFDGINDYVTTAPGILSNRNAFSMIAWIKPASFTASRVAICGQNDTAELGFIDPTQIQAWTALGGSVTLAYPYPRNQWHHVAVVANGTTLRIYFDGEVAATGGSPTANYGNSPDTFNIGGAVFDATGNYYPGAIDEVAVFSKALTDVQIRQLFTLGKNGPRGVRVRSWVELP